MAAGGGKFGAGVPVGLDFPSWCSRALAKSGSRASFDVGATERLANVLLSLPCRSLLGLPKQPINPGYSPVEWLGVATAARVRICLFLRLCGRFLPSNRVSARPAKIVACQSLIEYRDTWAVANSAFSLDLSAGRYVMQTRFRAWLQRDDDPNDRRRWAGCLELGLAVSAWQTGRYLREPRCRV